MKKETKVKKRDFVSCKMTGTVCEVCSDLVKPWASQMAQLVKNLPAMQETRDRSLSREDPMEKGMATHSSFLAWKIPGQTHVH